MLSLVQVGWRRTTCKNSIGNTSPPQATSTFPVELALERCNCFQSNSNTESWDRAVGYQYALTYPFDYRQIGYTTMLNVSKFPCLAYLLTHFFWEKNKSTFHIWDSAFSLLIWISSFIIPIKAHKCAVEITLYKIRWHLLTLKRDVS